MTPTYPVFVADRAAITQFGMSVGGSGLIIGQDELGHSVAIQMVRAEPIRIAVLGSITLSRTLAFRALGIDVRVAVSSSRPGTWTGLARAAGVPATQMLVSSAARFDPPKGAADAPVLVVLDAGGDQDSRLRLSPWRTVLHVLPRLLPQHHQLVASSDVVILQRQDASLAAPVGSLWSLPVQAVSQLAELAPSQLMVLWRVASARHSRLVNLISTPTENALFRALG